MKFQHAYSEPCRDSDLVCPEESLTQQSFKDDADINVMLERFRVTGVMPQGIVMPSYGDFNGISDYRSAVEAIRVADNAFMDLPANIRQRFDNDPQKYLEFFADEKNRPEAERLGLVPPPVPKDLAPAPADAAPSAGVSGS
nr:MAG TPA: Scaffold protein [Microviridae sp.]